MIRRIVEKERHKKKCDHVTRSLWTRTAHQNLEEGWLLCDFLSFTNSAIISNWNSFWGQLQATGTWQGCVLS